MQRNASQWRNPLRHRRFACALIVLAALLSEVASRWGGIGFWLASAALWLGGVVLEARTSDGLLTYRFPGTRRRSALLALGGAVAVAAGAIAAPIMPVGSEAALLMGGAGFLFAGGGALAWHHGATYAGDRIIRLRDEDS